MPVSRSAPSPVSRPEPDSALPEPVAAPPARPSTWAAKSSSAPAASSQIAKGSATAMPAASAISSGRAGGPRARRATAPRRRTGSTTANAMFISTAAEASAPAAAAVRAVPRVARYHAPGHRGDPELLGVGLVALQRGRARQQRHRHPGQHTRGAAAVVGGVAGDRERRQAREHDQRQAVEDGMVPAHEPQQREQHVGERALVVGRVDVRRPAVEDDLADVEILAGVVGDRGAQRREAGERHDRREHGEAGEGRVAQGEPHPALKPTGIDDARVPDALPAGPLRIGFVGCGRVTAELHLPALARVEGVEAVALADPDTACARRVAGEFGIARVHPDAATLAADPAVDLVAVCSPPRHHAEGALAALAAGRHVFVEKPLALDLEQARPAGRGRAATASPPRGFNLRVHRQVVAAREALADGRAGRAAHDPHPLDGGRAARGLARGSRRRAAARCGSWPSTTSTSGAS